MVACEAGANPVCRTLGLAVAAQHAACRTKRICSNEQHRQSNACVQMCCMASWSLMLAASIHARRAWNSYLELLGFFNLSSGIEPLLSCISYAVVNTLWLKHPMFREQSIGPTLLAANHELGGSRSGVVLQGHATQLQVIALLPAGRGSNMHFRTPQTLLGMGRLWLAMG